MTEIEKLQQENAELKEKLLMYKTKVATFPKRVKFARLNLGMKTVQLGEIIGVSANTISLYEREKCEPTMKTLIKLADALNVSLDWLCGRTDKMSGV